MRRLFAVCALAMLGLVAVGQASTSHAGWPMFGNRLIDFDNSGGSHTLYGIPGVHNELLGSYGSDTIYGSNAGDVIWADYHPDFTQYDPTRRYCPRLKEYIGYLPPSQKPTPADLPTVMAAYRRDNAACKALGPNTGKPRATLPPPSVAMIHGGNGKNFIYATDTTNYVWTGTGPTQVHASVGGGVIHCQSSQVTVFLSKRSRPHYKLPGCKHLSYFSVGY